MSNILLEIRPAARSGHVWAVAFEGEQQAIGCFQAFPNGEYLATNRRKPVSDRDVAIVQLLDSAIGRHKREIARLTQARRSLLKGESVDGLLKAEAK